MKIDLHCHTIAVKKGDGPGRNVTPELFKSKIEQADIKIAAITNHNKFDLNQYLLLCDAVNNMCQLWPGVEIDVFEPGSKRWHLIVIANPKETELFSKNVNKLFYGDNLDECTHTLDEIYNSFKDLDVIYITHFHEKRPAIPAEDGDKLDKLVKESYRVFKETSNEKSMGIFANYRYNVLVGSDVKEWSKYEESVFSELKLPVDSFEQFCLLARRDDTVVNTLLNKKESKKLIAHPAPNVDINICLYADINIIFGQKGTGKTEIIKSLCDEIIAAGYNCVKYVASERDGDFKYLLKKEGVKRSSILMNVDDCNSEFESIQNWIDINPTHFNNYINWKKTESNSANKTRMKITRASELTKEHTEDEVIHKQDKKLINNIEKSLKNISLSEYLSEEESLNLKGLIEKLALSIQRYVTEDVVASETVKLVNFSINKIKEIADMNTNSVSKPSALGLIGFVNARLNLLRNVKNILKAFAASEINNKERIGTLDEKGTIFINTKFRMYRDGISRTDEFEVGIRKMKEIKTELEYIKYHIFDYDLIEHIRNFNELCNEENISSITPFIGVSKQIVKESGEEYSPSNGEKGMLLLQRAINDEADAYFLDEPELGMGNSYIDTTIRPMLVNLSKRHKFVVVATHNANIGVRTLPYTSIYRTHSNGIYTTYIGNPFSDKLVNVNNEKDVLNWADESLKSLEGSRDAFYERKDIYESNHA